MSRSFDRCTSTADPGPGSRKQEAVCRRRQFFKIFMSSSCDVVWLCVLPMKCGGVSAVLKMERWFQRWRPFRDWFFGDCWEIWRTFVKIIVFLCIKNVMIKNLMISLSVKNYRKWERFFTVTCKSLVHKWATTETREHIWIEINSCSLVNQPKSLRESAHSILSGF